MFRQMINAVVAVLFVAFLMVSETLAGAGNPLNGLDVSLIDKSNSTPTAFSGSSGGLNINVTMDGDQTISNFNNTGLSNLTPGLSPTDVGYTQGETYSVTNTTNFTLTVEDPNTGASFSVPYSFQLPSTFAQQAELTSVDSQSGQTSYDYDLAVSQFDSQVPTIAVGNLGTPGDMWSVGLTFSLSSVDPSTGTAVNTVFDAGGETTDIAYSLYSSLAVTTMNHGTPVATESFPASAPFSFSPVPEPSTALLMAMTIVVLVGLGWRKRRTVVRHG